VELGFLDGDPEKLLVGVTATAFRGDKLALDTIFERIVFSRSIITMIRGGYLCDARGLSVRTRVDLNSVKTDAGDFNRGELAAAVNTPARNDLVVDSYLEHARERKSVVFCVDVAHSLDMAEAFRRRGAAAAAVFGAMDAEERKRVLADYATGRVDVLTNCNVLTEGWDAPDTSAIFLARPTKSAVLYTQMVGRGLRLSPEKKDCLVVDFVDIAGRHSLCGLATLAGINPKNASGEKSQRTLMEIYYEEAERKAWEKEKVAYKTETEAIELFAQASKFLWSKIGNHYRLVLPNNETVWCRHVDGNSDGYSCICVGADGKVTSISNDILPIGYAIGVCEDYVRLAKSGSANIVNKHAKWRNAPASEGQRQLLTKLGIPLSSGMTKGEASTLLDMRMKEPATRAQIKAIQRLRLHEYPELLMKYCAAKLLREYRRERSE
jgi:hypothetical protein